MWSDLFYPENPKRREQLIRKSQQLQDLMKNNFRATNQLIDTMNKHLCLCLSHISLNEEATLKENCDVMIECMQNIQAEVEKIDKELKEKLEPTLYEKLLKLSLSASDFETVAKVFEEICKVGTVGSTVLVGVLIKEGIILSRISGLFARIGAWTLASVGLAVVFLGIDMIVEAILGSIERDQLEAALKEYDCALDEFEPASEKYQDNITYVRIKIEMIEKEQKYV